MLRPLLALAFVLLFADRTLAWNTPVAPVKYTSWTWTGAIDNDWNKGGNWCGSYLNGQCRGQTSPPGSSATVVFNDACTTNCAPTLSADVSVFAINMSGFSGSVNQGAYKIALGQGGYFQNSGTFNAGSGNIEIGTAFNVPTFLITGGTFNGSSGLIRHGMASDSVTITSSAFHVLGGSFRAPSSTLRLQSNNVQILSTASFDPNGGLVQIEMPSNWNRTTISHPLNNLTLVSAAGKRINLDADLYVNGDLTLIGGSSTTGYLVGNKIHLLGNLMHTGFNFHGNTAIRFARPSGEQVIENTMIQPNHIYLPVMEFDQPSTSASVRFIGEIGFGSSLTATTTQGNFNTTASTFAFNNAAVLAKPVYNAPLLPLTNTRFASTAANTFSLTSLLIRGNLTISSSGTNTYSDTPGTIFLDGNLETTGDMAVAGNAFNVRLQGTSAQTITSGSANSWLPALTFANSGSGITFAGNNPQFTGTLTYESGAVSLPNPVRIRAATTSFLSISNLPIQNLAFEVNCDNVTLSQDLNVSGNVQFLNTSTARSLSGANLNVAGNISSVNSGAGFQGNATVRLIGPTDKTVDSTAFTSGLMLPNFEIDSGGTVTFIGRTRYYGSTFKYTQGTVDMTNSSQYFLGSASMTITPGPIQFKDVLIRPNSHTTISGGRMTVTNTLQLGSVALNRDLLSNGIDVYGNLEFVNNGFNGTQSIRMLGSNSRTISAEASAIYTPNVEVAKTGGAVVSLATPVAMQAGKTLAVSSGSMNLAAAANTLTVPGTLTLATGTSVKLSGATLTVGGTNVGAGPYSNGTIVP